MREMTIPINPQTAVTRDNVYTELAGVLFVQIVDSKKATFGIRRPLISIVKAAEAAMRNALGEVGGSVAGHCIWHGAMSGYRWSDSCRTCRQLEPMNLS